jgi:predicted nucleic acid-binding protein
LTRLEAALAGLGQLGIDSAPFIYYIENHPSYAAAIQSVIDRAEAGEIRLVTSVLTLTEVLSQPLEKQAPNIAVAYRAVLLESPELSLLPVNLEMAEQAAFFRARYRLKTADALQIATALQSGCEAFLTNDRELRRVREIPVLFLNELLDS